MTGPPRHEIQVAIFDFDGTLARLTIDFDRMKREAVEIIRRHGVRDAEIEEMYVLEMVSAAAERVADPARLHAECAAAIESVEVEAAACASLFDGVPEALDRLRSDGLKVGIITRNCRRAVLRVDPDLLGRVDALVARDDARRVKPDPEHVFQCLKEAGVPGAPSALVGDHPMDMVTAVAAGALPVGVTTGAGSAEELAEAGAEVLEDDLASAVAHILERRNSRG